VFRSPTDDARSDEDDDCDDFVFTPSVFALVVFIISIIGITAMDSKNIITATDVYHGFDHYFRHRSFIQLIDFARDRKN